VLSDLLSAERVRVPLRGQSKNDVLRELVQLAMPHADPAALDRVLSAVLEREALLSTGIGSGVAIPHGRTNQVDELIVAAGVTSTAIDFSALDGKPVSLFFLLLGPDSAAGAHVRALGRISRVVRHETVRGALAAAETREDFLQRLIGAEAV
jgi:nitrogen PTS system EIIA component